MFTYSGQGDRLTQSVDGVETRYTLDLNAGLTQVLSDGTNTYLYGLSRIGELQPEGFLYHLGDALGSVRQLVDAGGAVKLTRGYEPFGEVLSSNGSGSSAFAFAGEAQDMATGLVFLRARYLSVPTGRFLSKDIWSGDHTRPQTLDGWTYVVGDPINRSDPLGLCDNQSYAPGLYRVLGCRDSATGHYALLFGLGRNPWNRFALSPSARHSFAQEYWVPVRHPRDLAFGNIGKCPDSLQEVVQYYLHNDFTMWELNARNLLVETAITPSIEWDHWQLADIIGIAYSPYNRAAYNRRSPMAQWAPYRGDLTGDARKDAWYSPMRILLNTDPIRSNQYDPTSDIGYYGQFAIAHEDLYTTEEVVQRNLDSALAGQPQIRSWRAAFGGNNRQGLEASYELALIIAYGVDRRLFADPSYGATMYKARGESNPYSAGSHSYTCKAPSPTFFYDQDIYGTYGEASALTTRELAARGGWPGNEIMRDYRNKPGETWLTGYPPCVPLAP